MSLFDDIRADTNAILLDWQEVFTVNRLATTYNSERMPVESYVLQGTFAGDYQPATAELLRAEEGLKYRSEAIIYAPYGSDVQENDQITQVDGTVWYINRTDQHEGHLVIYLRRTQGQVT